MNIKPHVFTVLAYLFCVVGIVIFLILLQPPIDPPPSQRHIEQPQPIEERIAPAQPPVVNENKNKSKPRRAKSNRPKPRAMVYEADGNSGPS